MTVTNVHKDPASLTLTITSEFDAPLERVWQLWDDPRQLERWWGPPTYPATVVDHDLSPGSTVTYFMTGPDGDQPRGWWRVVAVEPPRLLEFEDGFTDSEGNPDPNMPTMTMRVTLSAHDGGTRMEIETRFPSADVLEQMLKMGHEEGMKEALGQIDGILAADVRE